MLNDLDETIRQVLIKKGGLDLADVAIDFDIPNREWSGGVSKPTLNCYLFDIHERRLLREDGWRVEGRGGRAAARRPPPLYFELNYLITAWTRGNSVETEHHLLWTVLQTLVRYPLLKESKSGQADDLSDEPLHDCLAGELRRYPWPIPATVAQLEGVLKSPGEFWTALENQIKPSLSYVVTLAVDREAQAAGPPVLATGIRMRLPEAAVGGSFWLGDLFHIEQDVPLGGVAVQVEGHDVRAETDAEGQFALGGLPPGRYQLAARIGGETQRRWVVLRGAVAQRGYSDVILGQDDAPLPGALIEVEGHSARAITDASGRFTLDLAPGAYTLRVYFDGWRERRRVVVRAGGYSLTLGYGGRPLAGADGTDS